MHVVLDRHITKTMWADGRQHDTPPLLQRQWQRTAEKPLWALEMNIYAKQKVKNFDKNFSQNRNRQADENA